MKNSIKQFTILCFTLFLSACGGSSGTETAATTPTEDTSSQTEQNNQTDTLTQALEAIYDRVPDISICDQGSLKQTERDKALATLNQIRALHGLKAVPYNSADDIYTEKSALIGVANAKLDHYPTADYQCFTNDGATGSENSNLHLSRIQGTVTELESSDKSIIEFLIDENVDNIGHRRWLLNPFLAYVSYGRVDGKPSVDSQWDFATGVSLKVINDENADISDSTIDYIAYPYGNYPAAYFQNGWYMSFSVLADKIDFWANQKSVDFSAASIEVTDSNSQALNVNSVSYYNDGRGLPNVLQWKVDGTVSNQEYTVKIQNVVVSNQAQNYEYTFTIQE
ncbi:hypothetical protein [Thiomicrorhabdus sp.]|uniref:hypothetical protein n=1 Tax=Thiomicrorhabdus sp. TaxID=2039724 RepID=UPI0029C7C54B|nr:hypothetical protein [Thiomicrorhabdus sp.]